MAWSKVRLIALLAVTLVWSSACAALCFGPPPPACHHCPVPCNSKPAPCRVQLADAEIPQPGAHVLSSLTTAGIDTAVVLPFEAPPPDAHQPRRPALQPSRTVADFSTCVLRI